MIAFIDDHRGAYGVEPICRMLKIAPIHLSRAHDARRRRPDTPPRVQRDAVLSVEIQRVFDENLQVYGVRKVWRVEQRKIRRVEIRLPQSSYALCLFGRRNSRVAAHIQLCDAPACQVSHH
jgi:hypothetical protein